MNHRTPSLVCKAIKPHWGVRGARDILELSQLLLNLAKAKIIIKHIFLGKEEPDRIIQRRTEYLHAPPTFYESGLL